MTQIVLDNITVKFPIFKSQKADIRYWKDLIFKSGRPDSFNALNEISLTFSSGDRIAVVGENGAGKSTLLRVLSRILPPTSGELIIDGSVFSLVTNAALIGEASCRQNIILNGLYMGFEQQQLNDYVNCVESIAQLGDFIQSPLANLSTGMRSRLMVAMIPNSKADILIMDEWIGTADRKVLEHGSGLLAEQIENSKIFIIASHRNEILERFCNKRLELVAGKVASYGDY